MSSYDFKKKWKARARPRFCVFLFG